MLAGGSDFLKRSSLGSAPDVAGHFLDLTDPALPDDPDGGEKLLPISLLYWVPTWKTRPVSLVTLEICLPSSMVRVRGFSQ